MHMESFSIYVFGHADADMLGCAGLPCHYQLNCAEVGRAEMDYL